MRLNCRLVYTVVVGKLLLQQPVVKLKLKNKWIILAKWYFNQAHSDIVILMVLVVFGEAVPLC